MVNRKVTKIGVGHLWAAIEDPTGPSSRQASSERSRTLKLFTFKMFTHLLTLPAVAVVADVGFQQDFSLVSQTCQLI